MVSPFWEGQRIGLKFHMLIAHTNSYRLAQKSGS